MAAGEITCFTRARQAVHTMSRRLIPLLDRVLVERIVAPTKSAGGVLLPESAVTKVGFPQHAAGVVPFTRCCSVAIGGVHGSRYAKRAPWMLSGQ